MPTLQSPALSLLAATGPTTTTPKKSNWEVIEHFNSSEKSRGSVSSSLIAVSKNTRNEVNFENEMNSSREFRYVLNPHVSCLLRNGKIN